VPSSEQVHGGSISEAVTGFKNLYITEYDGCDPVTSYIEAKKAVDYARSGKGPALLHAHVIRPYSHSMSDDEKMYRPESERQAERERDPVLTYPKFLVSEGILTEEEVDQIKAEVEATVDAAVDEALELPTPH